MKAYLQIVEIKQPRVKVKIDDISLGIFQGMFNSIYPDELNSPALLMSSDSEKGSDSEAGSDSEGEVEIVPQIEPSIGATVILQDLPDTTGPYGGGGKNPLNGKTAKIIGWWSKKPKGEDDPWVIEIDGKPFYPNGEKQWELEIEGFPGDPSKKNLFKADNFRVIKGGIGKSAQGSIPVLSKPEVPSEKVIRRGSIKDLQQLSDASSEASQASDSSEASQASDSSNVSGVSGVSGVSSSSEACEACEKCGKKENTIQSIVKLKNGGYKKIRRCLSHFE